SSPRTPRPSPRAISSMSTRATRRVLRGRKGRDPHPSRPSADPPSPARGEGSTEDREAPSLPSPLAGEGARRADEGVLGSHKMTETIIDPSIIETDNARRLADLRADYDSLGERLDRRGIAIDAIKARIAGFSIAVPSWGVGTGGTRFARFPGPG